MLSANVFSVFRKYHIPRKVKNKITATDIKNPGQYIFSDPKIHHLNPSITATIGLSEYTKRHLSGIMELLNPTGEMNNPN